MDYGPEVRRRFAAPARAGTLPETARGVVVGTAEDRSLNVWLQISVQARKGRIEAVRFRVYGCPHMVAAVDWTAERLEGRPIEALESFEPADVAEQLGIPREKFGKLLRIEDALRMCAARLGRSETEKGSG